MFVYHNQKMGSICTVFVKYHANTWFLPNNTKVAFWLILCFLL